MCGSPEHAPHGDQHGDGHVHRDGHGHSDWYSHRAGWLLCIPLFVLLVLPPPALGSYAAGRAGAAAPPAPAYHTYGPLPTGDVVDLSVRDYAIRAGWDRGRTLTGLVTLTGFVTPGTGNSWYLARLHVVCCAGDAQTAKVEVVDASRRYPTNAWVTVIGSWQPSDPHDLHGTVARIRADTVHAIPRPATRTNNRYQWQPDPRLWGDGDGPAESVLPGRSREDGGRRRAGGAVRPRRAG